jgi:hypothetical protein
MRSLMICIPQQISLGDQIHKNEMGRTRNMYGGMERCILGFGGEIWGKQTTWKNQVEMEG